MRDDHDMRAPAQSIQYVENKLKELYHVRQLDLYETDAFLMDKYMLKEMDRLAGIYAIVDEVILQDIYQGEEAKERQEYIYNSWWAHHECVLLKRWEVAIYYYALATGYTFIALIQDEKGRLEGFWFSGSYNSDVIMRLYYYMGDKLDWRAIDYERMKQFIAENKESL